LVFAFGANAAEIQGLDICLWPLSSHFEFLLFVPPASLFFLGSTGSSGNDSSFSDRLCLLRSSLRMCDALANPRGCPRTGEPGNSGIYLLFAGGRRFLLRPITNWSLQSSKVERAKVKPKLFLPTLLSKICLFSNSRRRRLAKGVSTG